MQVKTKETDGYEAVQLGFGNESLSNKPEKSCKANVTPKRFLKEIRCRCNNYQIGQELKADLSAGEAR